MVIPSRPTVSDDVMDFLLKDMFFFNVLYFERNISRDLYELIWRTNYHFIIVKPLIAAFVSIASLLDMASKSFPPAYRIVSSTKLKISVSLIKRRKSLIKTLKRIIPSVDLCGNPRMISNHSLKNEPTFSAQKVKSSIKDFFSKCHQIRKKLRIWSHLLKKSLMKNFILCAMFYPFMSLGKLVLHKS